MSNCIIARNDGGDLYAYCKERFWRCMSWQNFWSESLLTAQSYAEAHSKDSELTPEQFFVNVEQYTLLKAGEIGDEYIQALLAVAPDVAEPFGSSPPSTSDSPFDFSALGDLSGQASEADAQFDLHYGAAQDEYLISCIYLAKIHALTAKAGRYGGGTWTRWYKSKGLSEGSARTMVQNGDAFKSATVADLKMLPALTRKDLNLIARSGCAEQLTEAAGDSQQVQELLAQIKTEKARADTAEHQLEAVRADVAGLTQQVNAAEAREEEAWSLQAKAEARVKDAEKQLEGSRQVAKAATARAEKYKAEAEAARKQPIEAVVDEAEVERRANQIAHDIAEGLAADMTADLRARMEQGTSGSEQDARDAYDSILLAERNIQNSWKMAKPLFAKLPAEQRETLINLFVRSLGQMQGEVSRCL